MKSMSPSRPTPLHPLVLAGALLLGLVLLPGGPARADDLFIETDDYEEGEEIVGVFLTDEHYAKMIEDLERRGQDFDWGWALTPKWEASVEAAESGEEEKKRGFFRRRSRGPKPEQEPEELGFDLSDYRTVKVPEVENFSGIMKDDELASIRESFELAMKQTGLEPVASGSADLELKAAVVDINREGGGFGLIQIDPFIEIELRLRDLDAEQDLLLIRHQKHGSTPVDAALEFASQLAMFLR